MYGTSAYLIFTMDKLLNALIKQVQAVSGDQDSTELAGFYLQDRKKESTSLRQEASYRLDAESKTHDENLYKLEFVSWMISLSENCYISHSLPNLLPYKLRILLTHIFFGFSLLLLIFPFHNDPLKINSL